MILLLTTLVSAALETHQYKALRDSVVHNILAGNDSAALRQVEANIQEHPDDYLLLGFLGYAYDDITLDDLPDKWRVLREWTQDDIIKVWETFAQKHKNSIPVLKITSHLEGAENEAKVIAYTQRIQALDSLDPYPPLMYGLFGIINGHIDTAFAYLRRSNALDTAYRPALRSLRKLHFSLGNYDSVLFYNSRLLKQRLNPRVINGLILNSAILYLKTGAVAHAEEIVRHYITRNEDTLKLKDLQNIKDYIAARKSGLALASETTVVYSQEWNYATILNADSVAVFEYDKVFRPAEIVQRSSPVYPEEARMHDVEGTVILLVLVGESGTVEDAYVAISSGYEVLDKAALNAVRKTIFKPATVFEKQIKIWCAYPCRFDLSKW